MFKRYLMLLTLSAIVLTGCGRSAEEVAEGEQYRAEGIARADAYLKDKYGLDFELIDSELGIVESSPIPDFTPPYSGSVTLTYKIGDEEVIVYTNGIKCSDNYQASVIKQAVEDKVASTGINAIRIDSVYGRNDNLTEVFYDGTNLNEVLEGSKHIISTLDNVKDFPLDSLEGCAEIAVVQYRDLDAVNKVKSTSFNLKGTPILLDIELAAFQVAAYKDLDGYREFSMVDHGDFISVIEDGTYCNFTKVDNLDPEEFNGKGFISAKSVFDTYSIETDASKVHVYIPTSKFDEESELVTRYTYDGNDSYYKQTTWLTDDKKYLTSTIYNEEDLVFSVMVDRD